MNTATKKILVGAVTGAASIALYKIVLEPVLKTYFPNLGV